MELFVLDSAELNLPAETVCKLQALYSRDPSSMMIHIEDIGSSSVREFMERWYVQYGHDSIADCGSTLLAIEGVSMLAAKYVQHNNQYHGQELSSRYADMNVTGYYKPKDIDEAVVDSICMRLMGLYNVVLNSVYDQHLNKPKPEGVTDYVWKKTCKAKAFDTARGFLPCGTKTMLSWHGTLNNIDRNLPRMIFGPNAEMVEIGNSLLTKLKDTYAGTFTDYSMEEATWNLLSYSTAYSDYPETWGDGGVSAELKRSSSMEQFKTLLTTRPKYMVLPTTMNHAGSIDTTFSIDFGSYRDIQRHRCAEMNLPLVSPANSYHSWYLDSMEDEVLRLEVLDHLHTIYDELNEMAGKVNAVSLQYLCPLMTYVNVRASFTIPGFYYTMELRSSPLVHQTLREVCQSLTLQARGSWYKQCGWEPIDYVNMEDEKLDARRGNADIIKK